MVGAGVSEAVFEYAWDGGLVSSKDCRSAAEPKVPDLVCDMEEDDVLLPFAELVLSLLLLCQTSDDGSPDLREMLLLCESKIGELCAEWYKLPDESRLRTEGSEKLARALEVLSRANAARVNSPPRVGLDVEVE